MVGHAFADQARLRDESALGVALQKKIGFGGVRGIAVLVERDQRHHATDRIDLGAIEIRRYRNGLPLGYGHTRSGGGSGGRLAWGLGRGPGRNIRRDARSSGWLGVGRGGRRYRRVLLLLPGLPQKERRHREYDEQDQALRVHEDLNDGVIHQGKGELRKMIALAIGPRAPGRSRRDDTGDSAGRVARRARCP